MLWFYLTSAKPNLRPKPLSDTFQKKEMSQDRLKVFKGALLQAFKTQRSQSVAVAELLGLVNKDPTPAQGEGFQEGEVEQLLGRMQDDNQVMVSEGVVFLI
ncbi:maternal DNA replication licensing factor mcm3-like [Gadus macrocephalus]|uniref:maternal DNA replication licensing factor mcm3-like n=1 Tax=Gadus macrocephalus TaxID=80720 RepID=UPI0028CB246E|nr:maternal DNA replication licensing factor mcm3-like [Gadus macrocephalus]